MSGPSSPDIARLLAADRQGEGPPREQLFADCRGYLQVVARAQVESWMAAKVDASDVVQQALLEAHRDFDRFAGVTEAEWLAWLRRIVTHNAADFVRQYRGTAKRQARRETPLQTAGHGGSTHFMLGEPIAAEETPSRQLVRRDRQLLVATALARLPGDYREVIMLRNLERLPFDEVALRLERSRPAAQMLWARALKKLREELELLAPGESFSSWN